MGTPAMRTKPRIATMRHAVTKRCRTRATSITPWALTCITSMASTATITVVWICGGRASDHYLVNVAPTPIFSRLERSDNRMMRRSEMFGSMLILGTVAAADVPAL